MVTGLYVGVLMNEIILEERLKITRNRIINEGYIALFVLSFPTVLVIYHNQLATLMSSYLFITIFLMVVSLITLITVYIKRDKIPYRIRLWCIVGVMYLMGIFFATNFGYLEIGGLYIMTATLLIAIHFDEVVYKVFFYVSIGMLISCGLVFAWDILPLRRFSSGIYYHEFWIYGISSYAVLTAIIIRSIFAINTTMSSAVELLIEKKNELDGTYSELSENYQKLSLSSEKINYLAFYDQLTGLPNRINFISYVNSIIDASNTKEKFSVFYVDIDNQKTINKRVGPKHGDAIIKELAKGMKREIKDAKLIARIDGDEFAILTKNGDEEYIQWLHQRIQSICRSIVHEYPQCKNLSCSAGIAVYPQDGRACENLLQNGEAALAVAKESGRDSFICFDESVIRKISEREELIEDIRKGFEEGEFYLEYQPKFETVSGKVFSFEALARWNSPRYGKVSPLEFIPLMEEMGLIIPFGDMVMREALSQLKKWHREGYKDLTMAVNVSPIQLLEKGFFENTIEILETYEINPNSLEIEITENVFIDDFERVRNILIDFFEYGISIGLDDFGKGYSSLNYLRNLPIHTLKIDKTFIDVINSPMQDEVILSTIIRLAHALNLKVVAEGIEDGLQKSFLEVNKCDYLQGYYLCRPCHADEINIDLLNQSVVI